jgi:hypothetical protein
VSAPRGCPQGLKPGSFFLILIGTSGTRALPGLLWGGVHLGLKRDQEQVPHRAFGPVGSDKGCWWGVGVFAALEGLLHLWALRGA